MTKKISLTVNFVVACVFFVTILICSGTGHASPSNSLAVTSAESQIEIVEMSHWTKFRDHITGRRAREKERKLWGSRGGCRGGYPPPRFGRGGYPPPPPPRGPHRFHH